MKKKKKNTSRKNNGPSNSQLIDLLVVIFRENPSKKFNYKTLSKILKIKDLGVKIQIVEVLKEMVKNGVVTEESRGSYRLAEKTSIITSVIKNTSKRGVYANIDDENEVFIPRDYAQS